MHLIKFLMKILYPVYATCLICRNESVFRYGLCEDCFNALKELEGDRCEICLQHISTEGLCKDCFDNPPDYERLYCLYPYAPPLNTLLLSFKTAKRRYLAAPLADILMDALPKDTLALCTAIVPVPSSQKRLKERGFNQSLLLAEQLSYRTAIPVKQPLLRVKNTRTAALKKEERRKSIKGQFQRAEAIYGDTVLLVDDICTTGETLRACAAELKKAGAKRIFCVTVTRTEPKALT